MVMKATKKTRLEKKTIFVYKSKTASTETETCVSTTSFTTTVNTTGVAL